MAENHNAAEPAETDPIVRVQVGPGKQRLILPFENQEEATTYFNSIKDEETLAPERNGLLVSLNLVDATTIFLCQRAGDDLKIDFRPTRAAKDWIERSKLADCYPQSGKTVYIRRLRRVNTSESEGTDPSPRGPIVALLKRAETLVKRSSKSKTTKEPVASGAPVSRPVREN